MAKKFLTANYNDGDHNVKVGLTLILWEEDNVFYQYSPELDLTGYGKTKNEAEESFQYVLQDFIKYTLHKGTIFEELERLGWTTNKKKKRLHAPGEEQLLEDNETYKELINMPGILRSTTDFALSL
ncbi:hypothetical protein ACFGVS_26980 [Mucilaginibacter sp. AW1-7]|jgi:hypothetical protein|uniref:hypothetical protein n=1 Tax=unclassified Mucilaginibacter TaxID=2617802 RepID=UPI0008CE5D1E|nr:hypothetical protein [Mucilaginibacter sp. OK283]SEP42253.1 hypothetical protein SAMN05428947_11619 [Mucilaginibacter sp. OK283]